MRSKRKIIDAARYALDGGNDNRAIADLLKLLIEVEADRRDIEYIAAGRPASSNGWPKEEEWESEESEE